MKLKQLSHQSCVSLFGVVIIPCVIIHTTPIAQAQHLRHNRRTDKWFLWGCPGSSDRLHRIVRPMLLLNAISYLTVGFQRPLLQRDSPMILRQLGQPPGKKYI